MSTGTTLEGLLGVFLHGRFSRTWHLLALLIDAISVGAPWSHAYHCKFIVNPYLLYDLL